MAFPMFQPELGAVFQLGPRTYVGGKLAFAFSDFGAQAPPGILTVPRSSTAFELGVGGGHDLPLSSIVGLSFSGEIGVAGVSLTTEGFTTETDVHLLLAGRIALGVYAAPGAFRFYAGGTVGTSAMNDAISLRTEDCRSTLPCTTTETGHLSVAAVAMLGGGVRWQSNAFVSVGMEGWVPVSEAGTRLPFIFSLSLRLGDLVMKRRPTPARPPPPPPPEFPPDEPLPPPQI